MFSSVGCFQEPVVVCTFSLFSALKSMYLLPLFFTRILVSGWSLEMELKCDTYVLVTFSIFGYQTSISYTFLCLLQKIKLFFSDELGCGLDFGVPTLKMSI